MDLTAPAITVQVVAAPDSVSGWFPRTADNIEVRAFSSDGLGSGIADTSATLTLNPCRAAVPCSYEGVPLPDTVPRAFAFQVPRYAQAAGGEGALPFAVTIADAVGNVGRAVGVLRIDDAPPAIGTPFVVTGGILGEDGQIWFAGGPGAADVEIGVPVSDSGSGVASIALQLGSGDVVAGTALDVSAIVPRAPDGSFHFKLPASAVQGREGRLRFSLVAFDLLGHVTSRSGDPRDSIWVDALPPTIALAKVDYATVRGTGPDCAPNAIDFLCGRQLDSALKPTHLLRDDTATVTFDAVDCGAGAAATSQFSVAVRTAATTMSGIPVSQSALLAGNCSNGSPNSIHRYKFTLNPVTMAPVLDAPDTGGSSIIRIDSSGGDVLGHKASAISTATTGDGVALVSWWRWKRQVSGNITGSPSLLRDPAGSRRIAIATDAVSPASDVQVLAANGAIAAFANMPTGVIPSEIAVGTTNLYMAAAPLGAPTCGGSISCPNSILAIVAVTPSTTVETCTASSAIVGNPPALIFLNNTETAVAVAQAHSTTGNNMFFVTFAPAAAQCNVTATSVNVNGDFSGVTANVTANAGSIFMSDSLGFSSLDQSGGSFSTTSLASYSGPTPVNSLAPPALAPAVNPGPYGNPIFGGDAADHTVRRTFRTNCGTVPLTTPCWQTDSATYNDPNAGRAFTTLPYTQVFDGTNIWTTDTNGAVYAWTQTSGKPLFGTSGLPLGAKASPPVLLSSAPNNVALVVLADGTLVVVDSSKGTATKLGNAGAVGTDAPQVAPVLDVRSASQTSVAYVAGPGKWLYAWQLPWLPLPATNATWPRPGRDSCNSRNTATDPASCP